MLFLIIACQISSVIPQMPNIDQSVDLETFDAIIIGGGASGMATAMRLIELGIEPIILERQPALGGSGLYAGRFFAVDTPWQANHNIEDSVATALNEWTNQTQCLPHPALEAFLSESSAILDWIGPEYFNDVNYNVDVGWRIHPLNPDAGKPPLAVWAEYLASYTELNTKAIRIETTANGFYRVHTDSGSVYTSANIVVATGGFGRNIDFIQSVFPTMTENDWHSEAWPYADGSGLELISPFAPVDPFVSLHIHGVTDPLLSQPETMIVGDLSKALVVNQNGQRLFNEEDFEQLSFGVSQFSNHDFFVLFDAPLWSNTAFKAFSFNHPDLEDQILTSEQYENAAAPHIAETWVQLGSELGIPSDTLNQTVQDYNTGINEGNDTFGKDLQGIPAIGLPPFYALPLRYSSGRSFKGVDTNINMQVCHTEGCIEGLYAVGELQGLICASEGGYNGSITAAIYTGYAAAEHIVGLE